MLGPNAPRPFQKNKTFQTIVWDGKDDRGRYVAREAGDYRNIRIRVSLGLKARLERTLFWSPSKRVSGTKNEPVLMHARPEGVYVYDGGGGNFVKLFNYSGTYQRTVYPFPRKKVKGLTGIRMHQDSTPDEPIPLKWGQDMTTLFTFGWLQWGGEGWPCGKPGTHRDANANSYAGLPYGNRATVIAVNGKHIALSRLRLNRLAVDGSSGGLPMQGPDCWFKMPGRPGLNEGGIGEDHFVMINRNTIFGAVPSSMAFSPDNKWLYATGYLFTTGRYGHHRFALPGVTRMAYAKDKRPECWVGSMNPKKDGTGKGQFRYPCSLDVDAKGRVYVCDYINDRIQIFSPQAKLLNVLKTILPSEIRIDPKTGELYVFSWGIGSTYWVKKGKGKKVNSTLTRYSGYPEFKKRQTYKIPAGWRYIGDIIRYDYGWSRPNIKLAVDFWSTPVKLWWCEPENYRKDKFPNIRIFDILDNGELKIKKNFTRQAKKEIADVSPPFYYRTRLYTNPKDGMLFVEGCRGHNIPYLVRIDPGSGVSTVINIPFSAEDADFDMDGYAYFRALPVTAPEIPDLPWIIMRGHLPLKFTNSVSLFWTATGMSCCVSANMEISKMVCPWSKMGGRRHRGRLEATKSRS